MKVEIRNLGVVKRAEIDLRPLTVFVGPNNMGKTWMAYALSAILGPYGWNEYRKAYAGGKVTEKYPPLEAAIDQVWKEGNARIDLIDFANEYGQAYINDVARLTRQWIGDFLGTKRVSFDTLEVCVKFEETKSLFLEGIRAGRLESKLAAGRQRDEALLNALKEKGEATLYFYTVGTVLEALPPQAIKDFLAGAVFMMLHRAICFKVQVFPTERTTFITLPFAPLEPDVEAKSSNRLPKSRYLAVPVSNFLNFTADTLYGDHSDRIKKARKDPIIRTYIQLAQLLETEILCGNVSFSTEEPEPQREILFGAAEGVELEMPVVSSMVKELSTLVLYLRYVAQQDDWLIIDEPEMNLHPEAQVRLAEFLAMLVQASLHVIITTHSPYLVDHLSNLIKAAECQDKAGIQDKFFLKRSEAFIPREKVSVYLFQEGTAKNILDQDGLIDWGTFGDVSDRISQLYFEL